MIKKIDIYNILIIGTGLYIFIFLSCYFNYLSDDAFITFRYVKNFLHGLGPVYNVGEYVEGYSSVLWFLVLSGLGRLGVDIVGAGRAVGLIFGVLQITVLYFFLKKIKLSPISRLLGVIFISLSNIIAVWSLAGLEQVMYSFLILVNFVIICSISSWSKKTLLFLSLFSTLLVLTRLEGLFVPAIAIGFIIYQSSKKKVSFRDFILFYFLPFVAVIVSSFLIRYKLYGQWLPNTFYVKVGSNIEQYLRGIGYVWDFFWNYSFVIIFLVLIVYGFLNLTKITFFTLLFLFAIIGEVIMVGGDGLPMYRFLLPTLPYFAVLLALFIEKVNESISDRNVKYVIIFGLSAMLFYKAVMPPVTSVQYILYKDQKEYEIPRWTAVGKWLNKNTKENQSIAAVPIGAIGYYSDRYVYDMLGLTNKYIAHKKVDLGKGWAGHEKHDGQYILSQKPTYLLLGNIQALDYKLDFKDPQFVKPENPAIRAREDDIFTGDLLKYYEKKVADIGGGYYFHYLKLK